MRNNADPKTVNSPLPYWRDLSAIERLALTPAIGQAIQELAWARLRLNWINPGKILEGNLHASNDHLEALHPDSRTQVSRVTFIIPRVAARLPWRADCLIQALAAQRWLNRSGIGSRVTIGTRRGGKGEFMAHAWLKLGDKVILGGETSDFTPLLIDQTK